MTDAVDKPPATSLVQKPEVAELTKQFPGDQGLEALKDVVFGSVRDSHVDCTQ